MWGNLPEWSVLLGTVILWLRNGILLVGAALLIWSIYNEWTNNPDRFSWMSVIFKAIAFGLVAFVAVNAQTILTAIAPVV